MDEVIKEKGNILLLGNSGVGKSTLINAVLGSEVAETSYGTEGTTKKLKVYEDESYPFTLIDTAGFEPNIFKKMKTINEIRQWSKDNIEQETRKEIHEIWFCVDGTSSKLFKETIDALSWATSIWRTVPIIVVITKSYSEPEREKNVQMVNDALNNKKQLKDRVKAIIPVVASAFPISSKLYVEPEGILELIEKSNTILPFGVQAAAHDIDEYKLARRRILSQSVVGLAVAGAAVVGAVQIPFSDAALLGPIEIAEVNGIASVYGSAQNDKEKQFVNSIVSTGTVSLAAKAAIGALKAVPGINVGASVLNAAIAAGIAAAIGESSVHAFEQIYLGNKSYDDVDWVQKLVGDSLGKGFNKMILDVLNGLNSKSSAKDIAIIISKYFQQQMGK